jgi:hypothetical protein
LTALFLVWFAIAMAFPFSIAQAYSLPSKALIILLIIVLSSFAFVKIKTTTTNSYLAFILILQIGLAVFYFFIHSDAGYINLTLQFIATFIIYIVISGWIGHVRFRNSYVTILLVSGCLSVIVFFLCLIFNTPFYKEYVLIDGRRAYNFIFGFTNVLIDLGYTKIIRPSGFFDEPGSLAFYLIIAILINDLSTNNKWIRQICIFSGIFTLSIAFYIALFLYSILYLNLSLLKKIGIGSIIILPLLIGFITNLDDEKKDILYAYSIGRVETLFERDGNSLSSTRGDNRTELVDLAAGAIMDSPIVGQGISYRENKNSKLYGMFMGANLLGIFGIHGIFGGLIFSLHAIFYFLVAFIKGVKTGFSIPQKSFIIYFLLILQRPDYLGGIFTYLSVIVLIHTTIEYKKTIQK